MSLESGLYIIRSVEKYIGRRENEDRSLNPKPVVNLPEGVEAPKWEVERLDRDKYILKANGAPTAAIDNKVFAILLDEPAPTEWIIESVEYQGENLFVIKHSGEEFGGQGWVTPLEGDNEQIQCKPLIVHPSFPPRYPAFEVFEFVRVDRE